MRRQYRLLVDQGPVRALIESKLADGRLPHDSSPRFWGKPSNGEVCDACDEAIGWNQFVMEGVSTDLNTRAPQFHLACFHLWDAVRTAPGR